MAENPEIHPETRGPGTPEVTGPVNVPELPPSGNVDVATINVATDAFINGMAQAVLEDEEEFPDVDSDGETCHVKCSFAVSSFGASE